MVNLNLASQAIFGPSIREETALLVYLKVDLASELDSVVAQGWEPSVDYSFISNSLRLKPKGGKKKIDE